MQKEKKIKMLEDLGLSNNEALVYYELLLESPQSAYKIAKTISKSNSNTYLALDYLIDKGAVTLLEGKSTKEYSAVPINEFLEFRVINAKKQQTLLSEEFKNIASDSHTDQIFHLKDIDQLYLKAKYMIEQAKKIIMVDASPPQVERIREILERKGQEGLIVLVESRVDAPLKHCKTIRANSIGEYKNPGFNWLVISVDIKLTLVSFITESGELIDGLWIDNLLLSEWFYNGMFFEIMHHDDINRIKSNMTADEILEGMKEFCQQYRINYSSYIMKYLKNK